MIKNKKYLMSSRKDVTDAIKRIISDIDTKREAEYHYYHLDYEGNYLRKIPTKNAKLLKHHMSGHLLALRLKGTVGWKPAPRRWFI